MKRLALAAGGLLLTACGGATHTASPVTITQTVTVEPTVTQTVGHTPVPPTSPKTVIDPYGVYQSVIDNDGTYLIGVDISPGKYRKVVAGTMCYWARLRSLDASDIIDSHRGSGPQVVEIKESDTAFLTQDCGTWQMIPYF